MLEHGREEPVEAHAWRDTRQEPTRRHDMPATSHDMPATSVTGRAWRPVMSSKTAGSCRDEPAVVLDMRASRLTC